MISRGFDPVTREELSIKLVNRLRYGGWSISVLSAAGDNAKLNEDDVAVTFADDMVRIGVWDGMTPQVTSGRFRGRSEAWIAARYFRRRFPLLVGHVKPISWMKRENVRAGRLLYRAGLNSTDTLTLPSVSCTIVAITAEATVLEGAHIGDTGCVLYWHDGRSKLITNNSNAYWDELMFVLIRLMAALLKVPPSAVVQTPLFRRALRTMSRQKINARHGFGSGVLNGQRSAMRYMQRLRYCLDGVEAIFCFSDGMLRLGEPITTREGQLSYLKTLKESGLVGLLAEVRCREESDPTLEKHPRFKLHDDATGVFLTRDVSDEEEAEQVEMVGFWRKRVGELVVVFQETRARLKPALAHLPRPSQFTLPRIRFHE